MAHRILISGAGIAGPALACWLVDAGWDVTVVERDERLRDDGQNVDVRGAGREAARRLGIEDAILARNTTETGTEFVNADGESAASFDQDGDDGPTAELEILRGQLADLLHERSAGAKYRFGDRIDTVDAGETHATVRFASGAERDFDVVAIAEGQRSRTRDRLFDGVRLDPLNVDIAYATIPRQADDDDRWRVFVATDGRQVHLRPDNLGTIRAMLAFQTEPKGFDRLETPEQIAILRDRFAGAGWQTERVLDALSDSNLFYESLAQVRAPSWSAGRVVLLGDAAHCVTPLAGLGTSLALIGAYILAGELTSDDDHRAAFERYEARLRPLAEDVRKLPPGVPGIAYPDSKLGGDLIRLGAKAAAGPVGRVLASVTPSSKSDFELPDYP